LENQTPLALDELETHQSEPSDEVLLVAARSGDQQAFVELCERCRGSLKRTIFRIVKNHEDAEDILQDTILSAYSHLHNFQGTCKFNTWITRIGINRSLMLLRKRKVHSEVALCPVTSEPDARDKWEYPDPSPNPEQILADRQIRDLVRQAVRGLPVNYRRIVERYHGDECRLAEAAEDLGLTVQAVKSRLMRARRALRSSLKKRKITNSGGLGGNAKSRSFPQWDGQGIGQHAAM
jgi:RNA polymerase sigma-70 factor (ECF subfamily)